MKQKYHTKVGQGKTKKWKNNQERAKNQRPIYLQPQESHENTKLEAII